MTIELKSAFVQLLLVLCALTISCYATDEIPEVHTPLGQIKGSLMKTRLNKDIYSFRGIRYAKSPEGERRFKVAEPIDPWSNVLDASKEGPSCFRTDNATTASEDCLRLNIYTTKLPDFRNKVNRPVIVFFHSGGFYAYSARSDNYGPQYIMDHDIVLVTVNYRLGTLGFLASGDALAPGNLGLKDQVVALRWVQRNIAAFGGDSNSVTITGCSAGSWSTVLHITSPMSNGLFHKVIAMSGAPVPFLPMPANQSQTAMKQASLVGCPTHNWPAAFDCLKKLPAQLIRDSWLKFNVSDLIVPVIEPRLPGVERFLTAQPADLIRTKQFHQVPIITGITEDEFAFAPLFALEQALQGNETYYKYLTNDWESIAPTIFQYERGTDRSRYISREIKKFYFNDEPINLKYERTLGALYADAIIGFTAHRFARLVSANSRAPVYNYLFCFPGRYSFSVFSDTKKPYGVVHQDDLLYLFYMPSFGFPYFKLDDPENIMVEKLTTIWVSFATTGEPIPRNNELFQGVSWAPMTPRQENYLEIGNKLIMKKRMFGERYDLWERLFPLGPISSC